MKGKLQIWSKNHPWAVGLLGLVVALVLAWLSQPSAPALGDSASDLSLDTYIPSGQVLIPILVHNSESVDSIFGSHGIVDLYPVSDLGHQASRPLVRSAKMLRAPKNPSQFGVLVPAAAAAAIVRHAGPFHVVIHNPSATGTIFERASPRRTIIMEDP